MRPIRMVATSQQGQSMRVVPKVLAYAGGIGSRNVYVNVMDAEEASFSSANAVNMMELKEHELYPGQGVCVYVDNVDSAVPWAVSAWSSLVSRDAPGEMGMHGWCPGKP
ncbi:hypothetical protein FNV43_RR22932 [Rhamnella rubrinervis]|uniref:Uncharacterized protein n=1 Tax=Rhamnella rubrinervis TaxID=2594499 RepID=A0A8K0DY03_9ROSA|nr:hypothetical protein FNV43_RR22932 [Rhamnella rubrinervis]